MCMATWAASFYDNLLPVLYMCLATRRATLCVLLLRANTAIHTDVFLIVHVWLSVLRVLDHVYT